MPRWHETGSPGKAEPVSHFPPELKPLWPIMPDRVDDYLRRLGLDIVLWTPDDDDEPGTRPQVRITGPDFPTLRWDTPAAATAVEQAADDAQRRDLDLDGLYDAIERALEDVPPAVCIKSRFQQIAERDSKTLQAMAIRGSRKLARSALARKVYPDTGQEGPAEHLPAGTLVLLEDDGLFLASSTGMHWYRYRTRGGLQLEPEDE